MSPERVVCSCLGVTEGQVRAAIRRYSIRDLAGVMDWTEAGTGCNCCHPELRRLLAEETSGARYFESPPICSDR